MGNTGSTILENNLKITSNLFGRFNYSLYICRVNQKTNTMEDEMIKNYYNGQLNQVNYHSTYAPTFKIRGEGETKWMDLTPISAEALVRKLINEFKLEIK